MGSRYLGRICDSLGDMNIFAEVEMLGEFLDEMLPEIKGATQNSESPTQTRGSPENQAWEIIRAEIYDEMIG